MDNSTMKVVMVEPNKPAYITEIGKDLKSLQATVGGLIEPIGYLHDPDAIMVGNEEAKLIGLDALSAYGGKRCNRRFLEGIVAGPFFICGVKGEDFCSLSDEKCEEYVRLFAKPHEITQDDVEQDIRITLIGF